MIRIKASKRRKLPWLYVLDKMARLWDLQWYWAYLPKVIRFAREVKRVEGNLVWLKDGWVLGVDWAEIMLREQDNWGHYIWQGLKGSTVLDIGAGCGETARLFLRHGADRVICVDNNITACTCLRHNSLTYPITVIKSDFYPEMCFDVGIDLIKMDIEGYEVLLIDFMRRRGLRAKDLKPTVIEAHSEYCINELVKLGFKVSFEYRGDLKIVNNWC